VVLLFGWNSLAVDLEVEILTKVRNVCRPMQDVDKLYE